MSEHLNTGSPSHVGLVTGGASGIGAAVARRLVARGSRIVIADIDVACGQTLAADIGGTFVRTDVSDPDASADAVAHAVATYGRLDVVHLNAGVCGGSEIFDLDRYRRTMAVNVDGAVYGIQAALPRLREQGGGDIVVTASVAGLAGLQFDPSYTTSKHALVGLVRALGPALTGDGIRINALCPNFVDTPLIEKDKETLADLGVLVLEVGDVVDALEGLLASGGTGQAWLVQPGEKSAPFDFPDVPGFSSLFAAADG